MRIEFFGDEIDTIREFHASDQRTYGKDISTVWATPCRELQLTDQIRQRAKSLIGSIPNAEDMLGSIANAIPVEGMESLLPALVDDMEPVQGMLPKHALVMLSDPEKLRRAADDLAKTANEFLAASWHVAASGHGAGAPITFDQANFYDFEETISALVFSKHDVWKLTSFGVDATREGHIQLDATKPGEYRGDENKAASGIEGLLDAGYAVTITAAAQGTLTRLKRAINETGIANFDCVRSHAIDGFVDDAAKIALLTERDLTGRTSAAGQAKTPKRRRKAIDLMELKTGDYVVHEQHGIGRFVEMRQRTIGKGENQTTREYLVIEYAPSKRGAPADKLFIPTDQLDQVSKYIGAETPKLNKLGGSDWAATKAKARKHVHEIAEDLVKLYSARQRTKGYAFSKDTPVTGVSGSGKSTLVNQILYPVLADKLNGARIVPGKHTRVEGVDQCDKVIHVDQNPIGRTPRSNPATYTGVWDKIRTLFAKTPEAQVRGYGPGRFSFNVKGGRCEACHGDGTLKIEMNFLPDVYVDCEECHGQRYNRETLEVKYNGKSVADVLNMPIEEAAQFFKAYPSISRYLDTLVQVGLGYIRLGQPAPTLSGGESQRVKLATELQRRSTGKTVYILDEPTTGLHFEDVRKLLLVLQGLVDKGNTVIVIEHNLDVVKSADWIIDLGPEGGDGGGTIVTEGTPEQVAQCEQSWTGKFLRDML
ncbi:transcription-repair coupling factor [Bifidobacterium adolescentis]|nr:transcription-repair coupling factor [Bifidobacterium adolescentis]